MREIVIRHVNQAQTFDEIKFAVIKALEEVKSLTDCERIGYVSGIISSDGPEYMQRNMEILAEHVNKLRQENDFPIFGPTDVFNDEIHERIKAHEIPVQRWFDFWRDILGSGNITDIFMTPRWEESTGALDEYHTAVRLGLRVIEL
jgi:hypothetical protein